MSSTIGKVSPAYAHEAVGSVGIATVVDEGGVCVSGFIERAFGRWDGWCAFGVKHDVMVRIITILQRDDSFILLVLDIILHKVGVLVIVGGPHATDIQGVRQLCGLEQEMYVDIL